jgi:hypothetical protein
MRTRYARVSNASSWSKARESGFVAAILKAIGDGRDRILLAWPCKPDSGFVAAAVAMREARATGTLAHATLGFWPWRSGATHAARSILVHPKDVATVAGRAIRVERDQAAQAKTRLAHASLSMLEMRLNDLVKRSEPIDGPLSVEDTHIAARGTITVRSPTLLETTATFPPQDVAGSAPYVADASQILKRVRQHTHIDDDGSTMDAYIDAVGNPEVTPFAIFGLPPTVPGNVERCLSYARFKQHGLDVVVVDLTWTSRNALGANWDKELTSLAAALDGSEAARNSPLLVLCEDAGTMRKAAGVLRRYRRTAGTSRAHALRQGALLLEPGLLEGLPTTGPPEEVPNVRFEADIKDASLVPLRRRFLELAQRLRESSYVKGAQAVTTALRALRAFASLPIGLDEARSTAAVLYESDGAEDVAARSQFYPTSAMQPLSEAERACPEFAADIRSLVDAFKDRCDTWKVATPVSLKLVQLLAQSEWNASDVLLVLPDATTAEVFAVSDWGVTCRSSIATSNQLGEFLVNRHWRRILVVRPESRAVYELTTMRRTPERVLLLGDAAGVGLLQADVRTLSALPEFGAYAKRLAAISAALTSGGANEVFEPREPALSYEPSAPDDLSDFSQAPGGYKGATIRFHVESGSQVLYRPTGHVLLLTGDEVRPFRRKAARDVALGDSILVLHHELREALSIALARSRTTLAQLSHYHGVVARARDALPGASHRAKAREVLSRMQRIDPAIGAHEVPNITRWLSVEPDEELSLPTTARDRTRFDAFMAALNVDSSLAKAYWDFAILPCRRYRIQEGHAFNRRIVQFILDPEGVAGSHPASHDGVWQALMDSVEVIIDKEVSHG